MVGVAVILEEEGAAREGPAGAPDAPRNGPGSGMFVEAGRRSWTSGTDGSGPLSAGMRVASTGELVTSVDFGRAGDLGAGGRMDGRMGFGRRTGGANCCRQEIRPTDLRLGITYLLHLMHVIIEVFERRPKVLVAPLFCAVAGQGVRFRIPGKGERGVRTAWDPRCRARRSLARVGRIGFAGRGAPLAVWTVCGGWSYL